MKAKLFILKSVLAFSILLIFSCTSQKSYNPVHKPYILDTGIDSRSISFENPTGECGEGGKAASKLGVGRKGSPSRGINPGETVQLCDIKGQGIIRHIWMVVSRWRDPESLRSVIIRAYWDGQEHPSIECPVGDLMGFAHGKPMPYCSAVHSVSERGALNLWLPMPFTKHAKITITNELDEKTWLFYQIDYTINEKHPKDVGRLHVLFRRENPTMLKKDFVILPKRKGKGRFVGAVLGIRSLDTKRWWGEGEIKFYMDGDTDFPTICGTGSEDYVCLAYGVQQTPFFYNGCSLNQREFISMYRWHLPDPIYWKNECRITIQQIGYSREIEGGLFERQDDWSSAAFWYEQIPSEPLSPMPDRQVRAANLWKDKE